MLKPASVATVRGLRVAVERVIEAAKDPRLKLAAIDRAVKLCELEFKLSGELRPESVVAVATKVEVKFTGAAEWREALGE